MKKFEEELVNKKIVPIGATVKTIQEKLTNHFKDWISPEDYATGIVKWNHENQRLRTLLEAVEESGKEILDINKKLRGDLGDAQGKLRGSEDYIKELKSQLEKQQPEIPEVPQEVAEIYEKHVAQHHRLSETLLELYSCRLLDMTQGEIDDLVISMKLYGYSVKGKRFYLKNKLTGDCLARCLPRDSNGLYVEVTEKWLTRKEQTSYQLLFTQQEIDNMETGSYEQIEVEE